VDFLKGASERLAQPRRALDAALTGAGSLGGIERLAGYGVCKLKASARAPLASALQDAKLQGLLNVGSESFKGDPKKPWPVSRHWK
jgi:hypothetical protein